MGNRCTAEINPNVTPAHEVDSRRARRYRFSIEMTPSVLLGPRGRGEQGFERTVTHRITGNSEPASKDALSDVNPTTIQFEKKQEQSFSENINIQLHFCKKYNTKNVRLRAK